MRREETVRAPAPPQVSSRLAEPEGVHPVSGRIGRYELCFHLAAGGMATVYLARLAGPDGFEKLVALKTIHPHLAKDRRFVDMFLDEARIASRISHTNVCQIFDYGEADGTWFIAMEYLVGESLATFLHHLSKRHDLRTERRTRAVLLAMLAEACEGLHAAHELRDADGRPLGVVHRDVSHHNVFVTYDGAVKVVDFGIATASDRRYRTSTGEVKGKFAYMPPEQARAQKVDRTADVWSIGVMAWELIAVRRLFGRKTESATLLAITTDDILPPSRHVPTISPELDAVVLRALERRPAARWPTARELGLALVAASGEPRGAIGRPEIAALMDEVFPGGREARERLADLARTATADTIELTPDLATTLVGLAPVMAWEQTPVTDIRDVHGTASHAGDEDGYEDHVSSSGERLATRRDESARRDVERSSERSEERSVAVPDAGRSSTMTRVWIGVSLLAATLLGAGIATGLRPSDSGSVAVEVQPPTAPAVSAAPETAHPETSTPPTPEAAEVVTPTVLDDEPTLATKVSIRAARRAARPTTDLSAPTTPPARPATPVTEPRATGTLNVVSPGTWAEITSDGRSCETPCQLTLPAGRHDVRVVVHGEREPRREGVTIRPAEVTRLVITPR